MRRRHGGNGIRLRCQDYSQWESCERDLRRRVHVIGNCLGTDEYVHKHVHTGRSLDAGENVDARIQFIPIISKLLLYICEKLVNVDQKGSIGRNRDVRLHFLF